MKFIVEKERKLPVVYSPEILVAGAGPAGVGAAVAAGRMGVKTMLIERYGFPGGNLTGAMVNPLFTFHDEKGNQVIRGIAEEFVERMKRCGASPGHVRDLTFDNASMTPFDPERAKVVLIEMLEEAGVEMLFHTQAVGANVTDGVIESVIIENKSGRQAVSARYVIDCTGDADVAAFSGVPFAKGKESDGSMQPATLYFRVGGVDVASLRNWMKKNRDVLKDSPSDEEIDRQKAIAFLGMNQLVQEAKDSGMLHPEVAPRILMYELPTPGMFSVNTTRIQNIDGTNACDITRAEIALRKQVIEVQHFLREYIGGFENSCIIDSGIQAGIRETRRIAGEYELNEQEVLNSASFEDGIACGTFAIDIHPPHGKQQIFTGSGKSVYEIPYRCLIPKGVNNLLVAGRPISATHTAHGSIRVMATCMAMGQAAGTALAMASRNNCTAREVDVKQLRTELIKQGQYLLNENLQKIIDPALILDSKNSNGQKAGHYNPFKDKVPKIRCL
jgi:hypothetical protein